MKTNLYALVNKVDGGSVNAVSMAANDGILVRDNLPSLKRIFPFVVDDMEYVFLGMIEDGAYFTQCESRVVDWNAYKFPENNVEPLTLEQQAKLRNQ